MPLRLLAAGGAIVGVVLLFIALALRPSDASGASYTCDELLSRPAGVAADEGFATRDLGQAHVQPGTRITYGYCPPASGPHFNARGQGPIRPGFYPPDTAPQPGGWVHNLEHGYAVVLFRCADDVCPDAEELGALRAFASNAPATPGAAACGIPSKTVVARFDDMPTPYALLAWNRVALLDDFKPDAAFALAASWIDQGSPEPNGC